MSFGWNQLGGDAVAGLLAMAADPMEHVRQHPIFTLPIDLGPLTPHGELTVMSDIIVMMLVSAVLLMLLLPLGIRKRKGDDEVGRHVPRGPATGLELICWGLRDMVAKPLLGPHTDRFIGFIWTIFFFILTVNMLGILPLGSLSAHLGLPHVGGTATGNIWINSALALVTLVLMVVNGLRFGGVALSRALQPGAQGHALGGMKIVLVPLMVLLEVLGTFLKIFALVIRLFANMVAGHVLLAVLTGFILAAGAIGLVQGLGMAVMVVPATAAITLLEIFVAFLQAFIFTFLSVLFLGQSVLLHHHDEEAGAAH